MDVLMLGWEFPPHIAGGLGVACEGLTRALSRRGVRVTFLLPRPVEDVASGVPPAAPSTPSAQPAPEAPPTDVNASLSTEPGTELATEPSTNPRTGARAAMATRTAGEQPTGLARWVAPLQPRRLPDGRQEGGPWEVDAALDPAGDPEHASEEPREAAAAGVGELRLVPIPSTLSDPYARPAPAPVGLVAEAKGVAASRETPRNTGETTIPTASVSTPGTPTNTRVAEEPDGAAHAANDTLEKDEIEINPLTAAAEPARPGEPASQAEAAPVTPVRQAEADLPPIAVLGRADGPADGLGPYAGDLLAEAQRYAERCVVAASTQRFDVIHAHDWMTFPAGMAAAGRSGRPLVVHVHATEHDRSPRGPDARVLAIERRGMLAAVRVVCVSHFTRDLVIRRYGIHPAKVVVVHNGVEAPQEAAREATRCRIRGDDRVVLYLGRLTAQKGPEHFLHAAKLVLGREERVKFVIAGAGDESSRLVELAASLGIGHRVLFAGFLRGRDVDRVFRMADVYVMPSVSEPFGLAPLEAAARGVPVIVSRQAGVSEVLTHALRADFWDTRELAGLILSVLRRPSLAESLRDHAAVQVRSITWDRSARRCQAVYRQALALMPY